MKNIFKGLSLALVALLLVVGVGASSAFATSTYSLNNIAETGALTITSAGTMALVAGANNINIGNDATAKTINIGGAAADVINIGATGVSGIITLGNPASTSVTTISGSTLAGTNSLFAASTTSNITLGAGLTTGNLTLGKSTQAAGITAIYGGTAAANTIFNNVIDGSIAMGNALTTGTMAFGNATQTGATTVYGGSTTNAIRLLPVVGAVATEAHGVDVVSGGEMSSGDNLVGINSVLTPTGSAGTWASAVYGKVVQSTSQRLSGYMSGGEFEIANSVAGASNEMFPLVLDANNSSTYHPASAFMWMQDFGGGSKMPNLFTVTGTTVGTASATTLASTTADTAATHMIKIQINGTNYWLLATTTAPN